MDSQGELIVNTSYKDLFSDQNNLRVDSFILPEIDELVNMENSVLTRSLALLLAKIDNGQNVKYGIEIKSNGSERSSRIPMVRISESTASIWKISSGVGSLEKTIIALNDLAYFMKEHWDQKYKLPQEIVILKENEDIFSNPSSEYYLFVKELIENNNVKVISFDFLQHLIKNNTKTNFDEIILNSEKKIVTLKNNL